MKWIPVIHADTAETVTVDGYECDNCGYVAHREWLRCPKCNEQWTQAAKAFTDAIVKQP